MRAHSSSPWRVALIVGLASYIDAASITGFATSLVIYQHLLPLTPVDIGSASACLTAAIAIGAIVGGRIGDRIGRRPVYVATMVLIIVATMLLGLAESFALVAMAACLLGFGIGADLPVSLAAIADTATERNRGRLLVFSNLLWVLGVIANNILGAFVGDLGRFGVNVLIAHIVLMATIALVGRLTIVESHVWKRARAVERATRGGVSPAVIALRTFSEPRYRTVLIALIVFYSLTNIVANTNGQFGRYVLVNIGGISVAQASTVALASIPFVVLGTLWFMRVVDTPRRMAYFAVGALFAVASPLVLAAFGVGVLTYVVSAIMGAVGVAFAFEGMMKVWTQESFPTLLRSTAQGIVIGSARIVASAFAVVTPTLIAMGMTPFYGLLAICQLLGVLTGWLVFRRRKGFEVDVVPGLRSRS